MRTPTQSALAELFSEQGVDRVFTLMSEEIVPLLSELKRNETSDIEVIDARHEQGAAAMADGFSRVDHDLGVCIIGRGPGIAQTGTSLVTAKKNNSNVLYLVPEPSFSATHDKKSFEQTMYLKSTVGNVTSIRSTHNFVSEMRDAFRKVRQQDGPLAVQIPINVLDADVEKSGADRPASTVMSGQSPNLHPDEEVIKEVAELYTSSNYDTPPIILAGRGTKRDEAKAAVKLLAEEINAYLVTSIKARGYFSDYSHSLGFVGGLGADVANKRLRESEFVFAIGCSLNPYTVDSGELINEDASIVHIDVDRGRIGKHISPTIAIHGDAETTSNELAREINRVRNGETVDHRIEQTPGTDLRAYRPSQEQTDEPGRIDPEVLVERLDVMLPPNRTVVSDAGRFSTFVHDLISIERGDSYIWPVDFVAIGQALPMSVGATMAANEMPCVAFCGDAGFMMSFQELETAIRYDVPIIFVVMNDGTLGAEYQQARDGGFSGEAAIVGGPDFGHIAESMGGQGYTVQSTSDLEQLSGKLANADSPVVVDCKIPTEMPHRNLS